MYPKLDYAKFTTTTLDLDETLAAAAFKNSHGRPTMSDEDVKLALLSLFNTCKHQQAIIDELVAYANELRSIKPKKKFWTRK